ncbi:Nif3-like dinuclear metal center hexameric protein [Amycolatopsis sp.]|uniref:Nif3-like dinuclear metal center hexameric protein n=1 Tax=Amycolatopsis sp. TaxID=37632 RepID=UPI002BE72C51|nr:Nif3-like dinuclear metal center hexameric protein [Amycolatopsis sp.]HVV10776.1 Nif3-like dinuclear metal center hexameric protein [Amycolatopsis sp.]
MPALAEVITALETAYPPGLAESWDAVGLVCGDPDEPVGRVLCCVDPVAATIDEAIEIGAQLIVAHHPLLLRGVHGVPADTTKGRLVHRLIRAGAALYCAHTNADSASPGVSDALAEAIGLRVTGPLNPGQDGRTGIGRIGELPAAEPFSAFVQRVADALPATEPGVFGAGDPDRPIRTVAVSGGAGDSYLGVAAEAGVDAYVTADLRHHPAGEHVEAGGPALVGVTHWASEWPWCEQASGVLRDAFAGNVETYVSTRRTDPWTIRSSREHTQ